MVATFIQQGEKWRAQVRKKGAKPISKTFDTEAAARKWARDVESDIDRGQFVVPTKLTIDEIVTTYRDLKADSAKPVKPKSTEDYMLRYLSADLKGVTIERCTPQRLVEWAKVRRFEQAGPMTIGMELSKLGTVLRTVASFRNLKFPDVVGGARPLLHHLGLIGAGNQRDRRPSPDELVEIKKHCGAWLIDLIDVARLTGMRRGELVRLRWDDLDEARRLILVRDRKDPKQKVGNNQWVPLLADSFDIVMRQKRGKEEIFPYHPMSISKAFQRACQDAKINDLRFHDLRHEAASNLFEQGWEIPEVAAVTGHKTWSQLKRYTNIDPAKLHLKRVK